MQNAILPPPLKMSSSAILLRDIMLNAILLSAIVLNAILLCVVMLCRGAPSP
jgi:hypothetical protein